MKLTIYLSPSVDGITPIARDVYSEIWRGAAAASEDQAKKAARLWARETFDGDVRLKFKAEKTAGGAFAVICAQ
jgi:hypothetical protein